MGKVVPGVRQGLLCTHVGSGVYGVEGTRYLEKFTICLERREERGREEKLEDMQSFPHYGYHGRNKKKETIFLGSTYLQSNKVYLQTSLERNFRNFSYVFILSVNFKNLTVRLHILIIFFMHVKFQEDQRSIAISSNKC